MCMSVLVSATMLCLWKSEEGALDSLKQELQMVFSCHVNAGSSARAAGSLNLWAISLALPFVL